MLEEPVDEAVDADVLAEALDSGTQAADAAHDEVDLHARRGRGVEGVDGRLDEGVHLDDDACLLAAARRWRSRPISSRMRRCRLKGATRRLLKPLRAEAGEGVEELRDVLP